MIVRKLIARWRQACAARRAAVRLARLGPHLLRDIGLPEPPRRPP
jgi:uncharacterized protein YjiS (DUF1127 family)